MQNEKSNLEKAIVELNKEFGQGSVLRMDKKNAIDIESISTNCPPLDNVFGCGGMPRGRIIELYGAESSGKSSMALFFISQIQKWGGKAVFVDAENSFDSEYAKKIGVDVSKLIVNQPNYGEEGLKVVQKMVETRDVDIIVVDSVASLVPKRELEGEISDVSVAEQARMMSKALRMLSGSISRTKTVVIFINQMRDKIGVYWGVKTTTPGGRALRFHASVRLMVRKGKKILDSKGDVMGNWLEIEATKNKVGLPFRKATFELIYGKGIDLCGVILDTATAKKIITRTGSTYSYKGNKLAVGRDNAKEYLEKNPEVLKQIKGELEANDVKIEKEAKPENIKEPKNELELDK